MRFHHPLPDVTVLNDHLEVPGLGCIAVNAFVIHAAEPVVVDTGLGLPDRNFIGVLSRVIDPADVRWIWLTHPDRDHTGGLFALLDAAPQARLVTTFRGAGILSCDQPAPMNRVYFLNPGQALDVGDRMLVGFRPPLFDSPATVGLFDTSNGACLSSDCFGAPLPTADLATASDVASTAMDDLRTGQLLWATVDSPWIHAVDPTKFAALFEPLRRFDPSVVLSTHLPPAIGRMTELLATLSDAPNAQPFAAPDQTALETMLNAMAHPLRG